MNKLIRMFFLCIFAAPAVADDKGKSISIEGYGISTEIQKMCSNDTKFCIDDSALIPGHLSYGHPMPNMKNYKEIGFAIDNINGGYSTGTHYENANLMVLDTANTNVYVPENYLFIGAMKSKISLGVLQPDTKMDIETIKAALNGSNPSGHKLIYNSMPAHRLAAVHCLSIITGYDISKTESLLIANGVSAAGYDEMAKVLKSDGGIAFAYRQNSKAAEREEVFETYILNNGVPLSVNTAFYGKKDNIDQAVSTLNTLLKTTTLD